MFKRLLTPLLRAEQIIKEYRREEQWNQVRNATIIAIFAFLLMSVLNIYQHALFMLYTTLTGALGLMLGLFVGWKQKNTGVLETVFALILTVLFTSYILAGGNEGFAILWVIFVPFMFMMMIDVKKGLALSLYFLLLLFDVFYGPLEGLLRYDYPSMIRLRFPALYLIDMAFSFYSVRRNIIARSELILAQDQIRQASFLDTATGLKNRAAYTEYINTVSGGACGKLSVIYIDVNGLHELNNRKGHAEGDKMLRFVASACMAVFPRAEVFRLGGDEFLIICAICSEKEIEEKMVDLNGRIEAAGYTISYGIEFRQSGFDIEDMVNCADAKMLRNKADFYKARDRRQR